MPDVVLTPPQIGRRWRAKPDTVRTLLESGALRGFRVGKRWRVTLVAVEAFERGEQSGPKGQSAQPKPRRRRRQLQVIEFFK